MCTRLARCTAGVALLLAVDGRVAPRTADVLTVTTTGRDGTLDALELGTASVTAFSIADPSRRDANLDLNATSSTLASSEGAIAESSDGFARALAP